MRGQQGAQLAFDELDAPVARLHTRPMPHPFAPALERAMLVDYDGSVAASRKTLEIAAPLAADHGAPSIGLPPR